MKPSEKSSLSRPRVRLLEMMQKLDFGRIENLVVRDGEPVLTPRPRAVRDVKFGADAGPRPEAGLVDFTLKSRTRELFSHFDRLGSGTIRWLEVKHGLPFRMQVEEADG